MIILVADWFDEYGDFNIPTGKREYLVSHGVDLDTGKTIITDHFDPRKSTMCYFDEDMGEWVLKEKV